MVTVGYICRRLLKKEKLDMYTFLVSCAVFFSLLMIGIVLIQDSKGGGLTSQFNDYKRLFGTSKSHDFVERATWVLVVIIALICIVCAYVIH